MTDPLLRIEAVIESLGSPEADFWTPLEAMQGQVSNPEAQENCGFGHFGHFGRLRKDTIGEEVIECDENAPQGRFGTTRASRASSLIPGSVQSVQSVQNNEKCPLDQKVSVGHLTAPGVQDRDSGVQKPARTPFHTGPAAPGEAPIAWAEGFRLLRETSAPCGYPQHAWQQLIIDAERFLELWGAQAGSLGWPDWELFGCHRRAPWARIQGMGLVLLLRGKHLAAMTAAEAVIRSESGSCLTYRRKERDPLHPAERCLIWELDDA